LKNHEHFWWTTLVRGFVALIAGSAIMVIPDMAKSLLLLPIAIAVAILGLAVYGVLDSVLVFVTSYMVTLSWVTIVLRVQGIIGVTVGLLLYRVFFLRVQLHWFLILIAFQSLATAIGEGLIARHSRTDVTSLWNFTAAGIALGSGCMYFYIGLELTDRLTPLEVSWLVYGYLIAFGIAQCLTAARMIYSAHHKNPSHSIG
jgi:hypothetical protein